MLQVCLRYTITNWRYSTDRTERLQFSRIYLHEIMYQNISNSLVNILNDSTCATLQLGQYLVYITFNN